MSTPILMPAIMRVGKGSSLHLPDVLAQLGLRKPLIITGPIVIQYGYLERVTTPMDAAGMAYGVFSDVPPDPTDATVNAAIAQLQRDDYDCIVGLGGGSPMDTAKMVSLIGMRGGAVRDYAVPTDNNIPGLPVMAIPFSDALALAAMKLLYDNIRTACNEPGPEQIIALYEMVYSSSTTISEVTSLHYANVS